MAEKYIQKNQKGKQPPFPLINNLYHIYCNRFEKIDEIYEKNCQSHFISEKNSNLDIKFSDRYSENIEKFFSAIENELYNVNIYHLSSSHVPVNEATVEIFTIIGLFHFKNEFYQRFSHTLTVLNKKIIFEKMIFLDEIVRPSMHKNRRVLHCNTKNVRDEETLREIFKSAGKIFDVKIKENYFTMEFQNQDSIERVLENREFYGKKYEIYFSLQNLK